MLTEWVISRTIRRFQNLALGGPGSHLKVHRTPLSEPLTRLNLHY